MRTGPLTTLLAATVLGGGACQQPGGAERAEAGEPARAPRSDGPFLEGETCTRTEDCPRVARCVDGRCQPVVRCFEGEVLAERGARALAVGRFSEGAEAYRNAERAYRARQVPVPAGVACGLARAHIALTDRGGAAGAADAREVTARALASCLAAAPPGSAMADQALHSLAGLSERGLDAAALDRPDAGLMTGRDPRPTAENTHVRLTFTGQGEGTRAVFRELVTSEPIRREVTRCFLQWWEASRQTSDQGTIRVTYARLADDYDDLGAPRLTVAPADIAAAPADAGTNVHWLQCSAAAVQAAAAALRWPARADRWAESVVVFVGPS